MVGYACFPLRLTSSQRSAKILERNTNAQVQSASQREMTDVPATTKSAGTVISQKDRRVTQRAAEGTLPPWSFCLRTRVRDTAQRKHTLSTSAFSVVPLCTSFSLSGGERDQRKCRCRCR